MLVEKFNTSNNDYSHKSVPSLLLSQGHKLSSTIVALDDVENRVFPSPKRGKWIKVLLKLAVLLNGAVYGVRSRI